MITGICQNTGIDFGNSTNTQVEMESKNSTGKGRSGQITTP